MVILVPALKQFHIICSFSFYKFTINLCLACELINTVISRLLKLSWRYSIGKLDEVYKTVRFCTIYGLKRCVL